eukprot:3285288-Pyramimonas_sp.AAC.1
MQAASTCYGHCLHEALSCSCSVRSASARNLRPTQASLPRLPRLRNDTVMIALTRTQPLCYNGGAHAQTQRWSQPRQ